MKKYLLDTNILLFMASNPEKICKKIRDIINHKDSVLFISAASTWEIAIKTSINKLTLPSSIHLFVPLMIRKLNLNILNIEIEHTLVVSQLQKHHQDPFDHLLIAQAFYEDFTLLSADDKMQHYQIKLILNQ